jgi:SAM-dependent methyltransferase
MSSDALPPNLRPDAFVGAAADYARYRLPYPAQLLQSFLAEAALPTAGARLIDLACGPGRVTLAIADRFGEVLAVDLEPEMIEAGQHEAARRGIRHIRWSVGRAEDFDAPAGHINLVTIGEAFHRVDRPLVAAKAFGWLKPGGGLVTLGMQSFMHGDAPWRLIVKEISMHFVGRPAERKGGSPNPTPAEGLADQEAALRDAGFEVASFDFDFAHEWTLPDLLGNLRSMSTVSPHALGARHAAFEAELRAALLAFEPSGRYAEHISCGYTFARKPR